MPIPATGEHASARQTSPTTTRPGTGTRPPRRALRTAKAHRAHVFALYKKENAGPLGRARADRRLDLGPGDEADPLGRWAFRDIAQQVGTERRSTMSAARVLFL